MKAIIKKIFFPNKILGIVFFNLSFILLIFVFSSHREHSIIGYISYPASAYSLIIFCIWFYRACQFGNEFIKKSKPYNLYQANFRSIMKYSLFASLLLNLTYGLFKLITGIYYKSWWFITFAVYYLLLCIMKSSLVKGMNKAIDVEYIKLKITGIILLFLNLVLIGMIILIVIQNQSILYPGFIIYIIALYDFYLVILAIINIIKHRKHHNPIIIASKSINLSVAMISMISLAVAMITQFGNNDSSFKQVVISLMGAGIFIINMIMSIYMIIKANKKLKV